MHPLDTLWRRSAELLHPADLESRIDAWFAVRRAQSHGSARCEAAKLLFVAIYRRFCRVVGIAFFPRVGKLHAWTFSAQSRIDTTGICSLVGDTLAFVGEIGLEIENQAGRSGRLNRLASPGMLTTQNAAVSGSCLIERSSSPVSLPSSKS
jgi:hypothetical protein